MSPFVLSHIAFAFLGIITLIPAVILQFILKKNPNSYKIHKTLSLIGLVLIATGIASIVTFFTMVKAPHLNSLHGKIGAVGFLFLLDTAIIGHFFMKHSNLRKIHKLLGIIAMTLVLIAALLGTIQVIQFLRR